MRISKSYRFKPVTVTRLDILKRYYGDMSETELVEIAIDLLEDVIISLSLGSGDSTIWKDPAGIRYKIRIVD